MSPSVTVGLPVFNGDRYLEEAIRSILAQTHSDLELVIVDNASTDSTEEICRHFCSIDSRVRYSRNKENLGAARNYNLALEKAQGRYFKWFAHDDICRPEFIRVCVEALERDSDIVLAYPTPVDIDENGAELGLQDTGLGLDDPDPVVRFQDAMRQGHACIPVFGVTRTDILRLTDQHGNYPGADRVLIAELALWGKLHEVQEKLLLHREHNQRYVHTHQTDEDAAGWFDPSRTGNIHLRQWRQVSGYLEAIGRAPLTSRQRYRSRTYFLRWAFARRKGLAAEFVLGTIRSRRSRAG